MHFNQKPSKMKEQKEKRMGIYMAVLNSLADVNALLKKKGIAPIEETSDFRLTPTTDEVKAYQKEQSQASDAEAVISAEQLFIQETIEDVIQHYKLDQVAGFYGEEEGVNTMQIRQGVIYQVLNQPQILFEFFKKRCFDQQKTDEIYRFETYYHLAVEDAKQLF